MENNYQGDLADIFRPGSVNSGDPPGVSDWQYFDQSSDQETQMIQKSIRTHEQGFGQPFTSLLTDPLIHEGTSTPCFFGTNLDDLEEQVVSAARTPLEYEDHKINDNNNNHNHNHSHNIFSKMLQISPNAVKSTLSSNSDIMITSSPSPSPSSSSVVPPIKRCLLETSSATTLQISSPRNPGIKRRKSQAKKVVCIPAPAPANSRPTGEVVPSDLWAWRKYGQKPIKGSPYPRGYYRCSSSKGCSARKQVERSRTDPNMLVITYTSEHNHPWPTQRNALAGSTRTPQPPKTTAEQPSSEKHTTTEDVAAGSHVKDESSQAILLETEKLGLGSFPQSYRPELPEHGSGVDQDFFSSLGEIEVDPISMLLNQGFLGGDEEEAENYNKDLDPFG
ncbi:probable WRKY transcription factor 14 [Cynara cardunculus var. scolymus]|uniref:DNA-binding WRKY n=1 Tax=Cynara cardunculus var. scolymus TaxID=59895 RepID=A0A103XC20_CYNCS|nr:probable WRKY transcription factor 14 [Cynara cardunculus var. scolymus]KVH87931.1 DNA-binding WRKY [Cynara cardunculus var. scolymus]